MENTPPETARATSTEGQPQFERNGLKQDQRPKKNTTGECKRHRGCHPGVISLLLHNPHLHTHTHNTASIPAGTRSCGVHTQRRRRRPRRCPREPVDTGHQQKETERGEIEHTVKDSVHNQSHDSQLTQNQGTPLLTSRNKTEVDRHTHTHSRFACVPAVCAAPASLRPTEKNYIGRIWWATGSAKTCDRGWVRLS